MVRGSWISEASVADPKTDLVTWDAVGTGVVEGIQREGVPGTWNAQAILADHLEDRTGETG